MKINTIDIEICVTSIDSAGAIIECAHAGVCDEDARAVVAAASGGRGGAGGGALRARASRRRDVPRGGARRVVLAALVPVLRRALQVRRRGPRLRVRGFRASRSELSISQETVTVEV